MLRKIIGIIIIVVGTGLLAAVVYFMFFSKTNISEIVSKIKIIPAQNQAGPAKETGTALPVKPVDITAPETTKQIKVITGDKLEETADRIMVGKFGKEELASMAGSFAERFGSFSNQSNYSNIIDLNIFMSEKMKIWGNNYIAEQRQKAIPTDIYYGITTKTIASKLTEYDDDVGRAQALVTTRRREAAVTTSNISNTFSQDIVIKFIKEKNIWKVDSAFWQAE